jgi:hypothetical protein
MMPQEAAGRDGGRDADARSRRCRSCRRIAAGGIRYVHGAIAARAGPRERVQFARSAVPVVATAICLVSRPLVYSEAVDIQELLKARYPSCLV